LPKTGVSNVALEELAVARTITDLATVQHRLDLANGNWRNMLTECERHEIGSIPYRPFRAWDEPTHRQVLTAAASRHSKRQPDRSPSPVCSQSLPSQCPSPAPQHPRTSKTTSQRPSSDSTKTRYARSPRRSARANTRREPQWIGVQGKSDGSSGADRLNTAPATAGDALIRASSARSRTATCDSVSSPTRSTSPMT
jgi:hypothetical protein